MRYHYSRPDSEVEPGVVLGEILGKMVSGDVLVAPSADHLALSWCDLKDILEYLGSRGASFEPLLMSGNRSESLEQRHKHDLRRASATRARSRGSYKRCTGRPRKVNVEAVRQLRAEGNSPGAIAGRLGCSISSIYSALGRAA